MLRVTLPLVTLLLTAGCLSQQQSCIANATGEVRTLERLANATRGNITRGFGLEDRQELRERTVPCTRTLEDGTEIREFCTETRTITRQVPVTLNIDEERIKLRQLETRLAAARRTADAQVAACRQAFPEA